MAQRDVVRLTKSLWRGVGLSVFTLLISLSAEARIETIRWQYLDTTGIVGFRVYTSFDSGQFGAHLEDFLVAEATVGEDGNFIRMIDVDDLRSVYVVMTAYDDEGLESVKSNQKLLAAADSDNDGHPDGEDAFPNDPNEWLDDDNDGVGNNADLFDNDPTEWDDSDNDGVGDNSDVFPNDGSESVDSDNDGVGDNGDAFPSDPDESVDSDGDGFGDNFADAFPNDPFEWADADGDGFGDNFADADPNDPDVGRRTLSPYRVNAGSASDVSDSGERTWTRDAGFEAVGTSGGISAGQPIAATEDDVLYVTHRTGRISGEGLSYTFPVENGRYQVRLYFADSSGSAGVRRFDVDIEGEQALANFDIAAEAGAPYKAVVRSFETEVFDGELEITFVHQGGSAPPIVSAIEVVNRDANEGEILLSPGKPFIIEAF